MGERRGLMQLVVVSAALALVVAAVRVAAPLAPPYAAPPAPLRSARLIVDENALWATHAASRTVTRLALPSGARTLQIDLGCEPGTLVHEGVRLYVACVDTGEVIALDAASGAVVARRTVGHGTFGIVAAGPLYVSLEHDGAVVTLDPRTLAELARAPAGREPRGLALKDDRLYVVDLLDASLRVLDARSLASIGVIELGQQAGIAETVTPHPGRVDRVYVPHERLNVTNLARQFDNTVFPVVDAVDTLAGGPVRREALALDSVDTPVGTPIAVAIDPTRSRLYVANAASDDVSAVDLATGIGAGHVVVGQRPRDLALSPDASRLYVLDQLSNDVTVVDTATLTVSSRLAVADDPRPAEVKLGERTFTTSRPTTLARDHWIACASCHLDGGFDAQTWLGTAEGPRNTPVLRGIAGTEPLHASGTRADVQAFSKTFTDLMGGTGPSQGDLDALAAFVATLRPIPSPLRAADGSLTAAAVSGAAVFRDAGCASCHVPSAQFTDRQLHDVGTGIPVLGLREVEGGRFKTPSLRELWLTAPYLHDGRAATLGDAIAQHASARLGARDLRDLEAFLLELPLSGEETRSLFGQRQ